VLHIYNNSGKKKKKHSSKCEKRKEKNILKLLNGLQNINSDVRIHVDEGLKSDTLAMSGTEIESLSLNGLDILTISVFR
jgi:hypothetical protein